MKRLLKHISPFELALIVIMLAFHIRASTADAYAFPNHWFVRDDAYYYFKVAQNISEGNGSTFDGINVTNGYHPMWMLVCIPIFALARYDLILPLRVLLVVIALIHTGTSIIFYRLVKKHLSHAIAILTAIFWSFNPYIHTTVYEMGLETPIAIFFVVLMIHQLSRFEGEWRIGDIPPKRFAFLGVFASLAMLSRLDLVFFAFIVGVWVIFRGSPIRYFLPLDIAAIFVSMTSAVLLRTGFEAYNTTYASSVVEATLIALIVKISGFYLFGLYQHPRSATVWRWLRQAVIAIFFSVGVSTIVYILFVQIGMGKTFPRSAFLIDLSITLAYTLASRLLAAWFSSAGGHETDSPLAQLNSSWKKWFNEGLAYYGVVGGILIIYMFFSHFAFGTSSPVSGQIKRWWGSMGETAYEKPASNWPSYFGLGSGPFDSGQPFTEVLWYYNEVLRPRFVRGADMETERYFTLLSIALVVWLVFIFTYRHRSRQAAANLGLVPLLSASVIQILSYTATAYGGIKEWYWISQMVLLTLASGLFLDLLLKPLRRIYAANLFLILAALVFGVNSAYRFWGFVEYAMPHGLYGSNRPLMEVVAFIEANTLPGEVIGMTGGGNVGYLIKDRTIVNMDGLINSFEYFHTLQKGDAPLYLRNRGMTVVFANPRLLALPPYYGQFAPYLERFASFGGKDLLYLLEEPKY